MLRVTLIIFIISGAGGWLYSTDFDIVYEKISENICDTSDEQREELYISLKKFYVSPLNINKASGRELAALPLLSPVQADLLVKTRKHLPFTNIMQPVKLKLIPEDTYALLKPFIEVKSLSNDQADKLRMEVVNNFAVRQKSLVEDRVELWGMQNFGVITADKAFAKYFYKAEHRVNIAYKDFFELNLVTQHDRFEKNYFDIIKGASAFYPAGKLNIIALGAVNVHFGQRLLFSSSGYSSGKNSSSFINYHKSSSLKISRGISENYLLGAGLQLNTPGLEFITFGGRFNYDAFVASGNFFSQKKYVTAIDMYQRHDTAAAVEEKNQQKEYVAGLHFGFRPSCRNMLGISSLFSSFKYPIKPDFTEYEPGRFWGQAWGGLAIDWRKTVGRKHVFYGETAHVLVPAMKNPASWNINKLPSYGHEWGIISGFVWKPGAAFTCQSAWRYYTPQLPLLHNRALAEDKPAAEMGAYNSFDWNINNYLQTALYIDIFKATARADMEPAGADIAARIKWKIVDKLCLTLRSTLSSSSRQVEQEQGEAAGIFQALSYTGSEPSLKVKCKLHYNNDFVYLRVCNIFSLQGEGLHQVNDAMILDLDWFPSSFISLSCRYTLFKAPGTIIYSGKRNISGLHTGLAMLTGRGFRCTILTKLNIKEHIGLQLKYLRGRLSSKDENQKPVAEKEEELQVQLWLER
ncbi:MAG TPA: hypothetical protein VKS21_12915 [Spirochaetota bacterium]|nr:hypothetical protein [Spirochaetota bacterium]